MQAQAPQPPEALDAAVAAERLRNARFVNAGRAAGVAVTLAIELFLQTSQRDYQGSQIGLHATWLACAAVLLVACWRSDAIARWAGLALPLLDMPLFFTLMYGLISRLQATGFSDDARAVAAGVTVFFALMVLMSGAMLERRLLVVSVGLALALAATLQLHAGVDYSLGLFMLVSIVLAFSISLAVGRRSVALVAAVTDEQLRRERLGRYFSPQITQRLLERGDDAGRGESREVTVLFADLRDFTALGETMPGPEVVALLNAIHEGWVEAVFEHGGTLDKYMGDGIMAYFGAPLAQADHAARALRCARAMDASLRRLNQQRAAAGAPGLRLGIGIHSGRVVLGDIGAARRREFTVIGHTVNIAARLENLTKEIGRPILLSAETARRAGSVDGLSSVGPVEIRGQTEPMQVFALSEPA